ncbi:tyrosine-type recombinase/integrase [Pseudomonas monteilii]|uniref:tyrosine-type recombinase/integrase n=2 Tax=Pseudomonas putida group TaxID=136845 RepID=UPI003D95FAD8
MRVPVYPEDLLRTGGFKRLAKTLQKKWCGSKHLTLSLAQELMAQGLGYQDLHDLQRSSKECQVDDSCPLIADLQRNVMSVLEGVTGAEQRDVVGLVELELMIRSLPFSSLTALKPTHTAPVQTTHLAATRSWLASHREGMRRAADVNSRSDRPSLTLDQLESIVGVVSESESLRDQALLGCVLSGLRLTELQSARVNDLRIVNGVLFNRRPHRRALHLADVTVIQQYIKFSGLKGDDYLFPNAGNQRSPLTSWSFDKLLSSWAIKAGLAPSLVKVTQIRHLVAKLIEAQIPQIAERMGTSSTDFVRVLMSSHWKGLLPNRPGKSMRSA